MTTTIPSTLQAHAPDPDDRLIKRARVLQLMRDRDIQSLVLTSAPTINWYLDGARTHVSFAAPPIVNVVVTEETDTVLLTSNEHTRLVEEELPTDVEVVSRRWWESAPVGQHREDEYVTELRVARSIVLPAESARFAEVGRLAAEAVTDALSDVSRTNSERNVAASVTRDLVSRGLEPLVVLVGGQERLHYRHPLPTNSPIGRVAMVVVCARRWGLIANLTRWVRFGAASPEELDAETRILEVEAQAFAATRAGATLSGALESIAASYSLHGFGPDEWTLHHQGGLAGYDGRDPRAAPGLPDVIPEKAFVAWNPSAKQTKVEDTVLIENGVITPITFDARWPTRLVSGVPRPLPWQH